MAKVSVEDFSRISRRQIDDDLKRFLTACAELDAQFVKGGRYNSGARYAGLCRIAEERFKDALDSNLSRMLRFAAAEGIEPDALISASAYHFQQLINGLVNRVKQGFDANFEQAEKEFREDLNERLSDAMADARIGYVGGERVMVQQLSPQERRLQLLKHIYDKSGADSMEPVDLREVGNEIGMDDRAVQTAAQYLIDKVFIQSLMADDVTITADGIDVVEEALKAPDRPTTYFPPAGNITIYENIYGSQISHGSPGSVQTLTVNPDDRATIESLLTEITDTKAQLELMAADMAALDADIDTIRAQLRSPRPKSSIIKEGLISIRTIFENAAGSALAGGYTSQINAILGS